MKEFADRLNALLKYKESDVQALSAATGVAQSTVCHWLAGKSVPTYGNLVLIADFFNTTADYLIGRKDDYRCVPNSMITLGAEEQKIFYKISCLSMEQLRRVEGYADFLLGK